MGSKTLPSTCYILSGESNIRFYSSSNGYNAFSPEYILCHSCGLSTKLNLEICTTKKYVYSMFLKKIKEIIRI